MAGMASACPELQLYCKLESHRVSGWPGVGLKAICHLGMTKGTNTQNSSRASEGLSSQRG